jgi:hypothetical protein
MQGSRLKIGIMAGLLVMIILISNRTNAWASQDQSPVHQTVPTRIRNTATSTPMAVTPTKIPSETPNSSTPTRFETPIRPTAALPTTTPKKIPTQTKTLAGTTTQPSATPSSTPSATPAPTITSTATITQPPDIRPTITDTAIMPTMTEVPPSVTPAPQSPARIGKNGTVVEIVGILLIISGVLAYVLWKRRSR